ncbi:unnamed protein product [Lymnaea stagnalis]|uniref:Ig-like domain-containing protein n=1 Tax=Lymnaea stagnalis TaxID=6523 RepID=A0AAV2HSE3_LYMST
MADCTRTFGGGFSSRTLLERRTPFDDNKMNNFIHYVILSALLHTCCNADKDRLHISSFTVNKHHVTPYIFGVPLGRDVTLRCEVSGETNLKLTRLGQTLHTVQTSRSITHVLKNVTCQDTGAYVCEAHGSTNKDTRTANINVQFCPPQLCQQNDSIRVVTVPIGRDYQISTCIYTHVSSDQYPVITLKNNIRLKKNSRSNKYGFHWSKKDLQMHHTAVITIRHVAENDYGALEVELNITAKNSMHFTVYILKPNASYIVDFTANNNELTASSSKPVTLACKAAAFKPIFRLYRRGNETELARRTGSLNPSSEMLHTLSGTCGDTGAYVCLVEDVRGVVVKKEMEIAFQNCPPLPCNEESTSKIALANVSDNLTVSFCVMTYNGIQPIVEIDADKIRVNDTSKRFHVDIATQGYQSRVSISINDVQYEDFDEYRVKISTPGQPASENRSTEMSFEIINVNNKECDLYKRKITVFTHIGGNATARFCVQHDERWLNETEALNEETYPPLTRDGSQGKVRIWLNSTDGQQYRFFTVVINNVELHDLKQYNFVTPKDSLNYTVDLQLQTDTLQFCNSSDKHRVARAELAGKILVHTCIALSKSTKNSSIFVEFNGTDFKNMGCIGKKCALWAPENASSMAYIFSVRMENLSVLDFGNVTTKVGLYNESNDSVISQLTFTLQLERIYVVRSNTPAKMYGIKPEGDEVVESGVAPNTILVITMAITGTLVVVVLVGYAVKKCKGEIIVSNRERREHHVVNADLVRSTSDGGPSRELQPMYVNTEGEDHRMDM